MLTAPDRPAGRRLQSTPSAVKAAALDRGLDVFQPENLRAPEVLKRLRTARPDAMVVAAYGLILPQPLLDVATHGAINIHASLLPRWRGAAPIQRAILAGDRETGVSIMGMDAGLDTGPVFAQRRVSIGTDDDFGVLHDRLAELGADTLLTVLADLATGKARSSAQPATGATYARKIEKAETALRWERPAAELERTVRAFRPSPGALARLKGEAIKVWRGRVVTGRGTPGLILDASTAIHVACGTDALAIDELQPAGGRRMQAADFLRGRQLARGERFD